MSDVDVENGLLVTHFGSAPVPPEVLAVYRENPADPRLQMWERHAKMKIETSWVEGIEADAVQFAPLAPVLDAEAKAEIEAIVTAARREAEATVLAHETKQVN